MKKNIIKELKKIRANTLAYKWVLQKLADSIAHQVTQDKLNEFAKVAEEETIALNDLISDLGGDIEKSEQQNNQKSGDWVKRPLPDPKNMQAVLACLIEAERNKEDDYNAILGHEEMEREYKNRLSKHRKEAETNLIYFQTALEALDHK